MPTAARCGDTHARRMVNGSTYRSGASALSHLLTSHLQRPERTLSVDTEHHEARTLPHRQLPIAVIEEYAGVGTFLATFVHLGVRAHSASEKKNAKHPVLRARHPTMILREFAAEPAPLPAEHYVLVCAGLQYQPFAPGGSRLADKDPRAVVDVTDTAPASTERLGDRYVSVDVEEHEDLLLRGRGVFGTLVSNMSALTVPMELSPPAPEGLSPHLCNGPLWRHGASPSASSSSARSPGSARRRRSHCSSSARRRSPT